MYGSPKNVVKKWRVQSVVWSMVCSLPNDPVYSQNVEIFFHVGIGKACRIRLLLVSSRIVSSFAGLLLLRILLCLSIFTGFIYRSITCLELGFRYLFEKMKYSDFSEIFVFKGYPMFKSLF